MALQTLTPNSSVPAVIGRGLLPTGEKKPWANASRAGYFIIFMIFGVFGVWAATAPLASGVIASGKLIPESKTKSVEHAEGGTIAEILVREGDRVKAGQILLRLNPLRVNAIGGVYRHRYFIMLAEISRLRAQRDDAEEISFDPDLLQHMDDPLVIEIIEKAKQVYAAQRDLLHRQIEIRREQIAQSYTSLEGMYEREKSMEKQLHLIDEEMKGVLELFKKGLERRPRVLALQRARASIEGGLGQITTQEAQILQQIGQNELMITAALKQQRQGAMERLHALEGQAHDLTERLTLVEDQIDRIAIRSPADGIVNNMQVNTIGELIGAGRTLMDIVPTNDRLIVQALIKGKEIDSVKIGATVQVRIMAFNPRLYAPVTGVLRSLAADTTAAAPGSRSKGGYKAIIQLDEESIVKSLRGKMLVPGMAAAATIAVGERTLVSYLLTPLTSSFEQALREP